MEGAMQDWWWETQALLPILTPARCAVLDQLLPFLGLRVLIRARLNMATDYLQNFPSRDGVLLSLPSIPPPASTLAQVSITPSLPDSSPYIHHAPAPFPKHAMPRITNNPKHTLELSFVTRHSYLAPFPLNLSLSASFTLL